MGEGACKSRRPSREQVLVFLGGQPLLQQLLPSVLEAIAAAVEVQDFAPGDYLAREGSPGEGLYMIWHGQVAVPAGSGRRESIVMQENDFFGHAKAGPAKVLLKADVIAITSVSCLVLKHKDADLAALTGATSAPELPVVEKILTLEALEVDLHRGVTPPEGDLYPRMFGGQLLGQALAAACKSVDPSLSVHSLHSYFLVAGDSTVPVVYQVERIKDGHSFAARRVCAVQKGRNIFLLHASFQRPEQGLEHQRAMPPPPCQPDALLSWEELQRQYSCDARIPVAVRAKFAGKRHDPMPVDFRFCHPFDAVNPGLLPPRQLVWMRVRGRLSNDPILHSAALAYASDFALLDAVLLTHGIPRPDPSVTVASLDHSIWFHRPVKADDWLLYEICSPRSSGSRGLCLGFFYACTGELVATVAQEALIRLPNYPLPIVTPRSKSSAVAASSASISANSEGEASTTSSASNGIVSKL